MMAAREVGFYHETEELLKRLHLQHGGIVVLEVIVCALPEVRMWGGCDGDGVTIYFKGCRLPCPLELLQIDLSVVCKCFGHAVNEFRSVLGRVSAGNCKDGQSNAKG